MIKKYLLNDKTVTCLMFNFPTVYQRIKHLDIVYGIYNAIDAETDDMQPIVGIAKLHPEDEFDMEKGNKIAGTRADIKYHQALARDLKKIKEKIIYELTELDKVIEKEEKTIKHCKQFLEELM
jgi:hypothetical protein